MALESTRTLEQLSDECMTRGLSVTPSGKNGKYKKEDFIRALRADYLVEQYGEPENVPFPLRFMLTMDCPMLCKRYAQCKEATQIAIWKNDGKYAVEEKIDGCMTYNTPVLLADGTTMPIGEIVDKRLSVEVLSLDESTHELVPRKVISWFNHGTKPSSQWVRKIHAHDASYHAHDRGCHFTRNHVFFKVHNEWDEDFCGEWRMLDSRLDPTKMQCLVRVYKREEWEVNKTSDKKFFHVKESGNGYVLVKTADAGLAGFTSESFNDVVTEYGAVAYDIEVEGSHNFVADGFIVHNSRSVLIYDADTQKFDFYSRHNSVDDFLPISYRNNVRVFGNFQSDTSFVLDCEVISTNSNIATRKVCTSQLNSTSALLSLDSAKSLEIQENNPLMFVIFDCLYDGVDIRSLPWKARHVHAEKLAKALKDSGFMCMINEYTLTNKREFYERMLRESREGIVAKRTDAPYSSTTSRTDDMVKLKRTVKCDLANDLDAWITGFTEATQGKANENYIGGLIFSCQVKQADGRVIVREIGRVAGIPQDLRVEMTDYDANGKPCLKQEFYGRVATLSGQDISGVSKRLTHCTIEAWRPDKGISDCEVLDEEELAKLIL